MLAVLFDQTSKTVIVSTLIVSTLISVLSLTIAIIATTTARHVKRRYKTLLRGKEGANLEQMILANHEEVARVSDRLTDIERSLNNHESRLIKKVSAPQMIRYNAFAEAGNDLSFSMAMLDEDGNGMVLSSIYGREESRVYAKPFVKGESTYPLTPEEKTVIRGESVPVQKLKKKAY